MCSVKTQFTSTRVPNKEVVAKGLKVKEVICEGEGKECEQNSYNIQEAMGQNFTYFWHENILKDLSCKKKVDTNRNGYYCFIKSFIIKP